jgi:hypothetical protein
MESSRNKAILDGVGELVLDAVLQFCKHPTLQYQWIRYLPQNVSEPFWQKLVGNIHTVLKCNPVLRGRSKGPLRRIDELKFVPDTFKDKFGNPLVAHLPEEVYLAAEYEWKEIVVLRSLGLNDLDFHAIIARFRRDPPQVIVLQV